MSVPLDAAAGATSAVTAIAGAPLRPEILVVDDEDAVRTMILRILARERYVVHEARHGLEALAVLGTAPNVRLVISDVFMMEMDGYELGRRVAQRWPDLPVLYISGYLEAADLSPDPHGVPRRFLRKPFGPDALLRKVWEVVPRRFA
jgi:two-component system cell cycle sensor histidine kinase/response regulator CckA